MVFPSNNYWMWFFLDEKKLGQYEEKPLFEEVLLPNLEYHPSEDVSEPLATFFVSNEHTNPFGAMHGGCHAMVMEQVALSYAQQKLNSQGLMLEAMQIDYLSAGKKGAIDVFCETIGEESGSFSSPNDDNSLLVRVFLKDQKNGRICSEGKLRISAMETKVASRL